jgi:hypothetical protein
VYWAVVFGEDAPDNVLLDVYPECLGDLLRNSKAAKARVALL